jgi:hypothetical protein
MHRNFRRVKWIQILMPVKGRQTWTCTTDIVMCLLNPHCGFLCAVLVQLISTAATTFSFDSCCQCVTYRSHDLYIYSVQSLQLSKVFRLACLFWEMCLLYTLVLHFGQDLFPVSLVLRVTFDVGTSTALFAAVWLTDHKLRLLSDMKFSRFDH